MKVSRNFAAYFAAIWAVLFGILHLIWATGYYLWLSNKQAEQAFEKTWFYVYNLIAALLFLLAGGLGILLSNNKTKWKKLVIICGWCCAVILIIRGMSAVLLWLYFNISRNLNYTALSFWDIWFLIGGLLFLLSVRKFQRNL
jgi:uncharacterized membrane protein